jgi:hypothetical protein
MEKKIYLKETLVKYLNRVSSATNLGGIHIELELSPIDIYDID